MPRVSAGLRNLISTFLWLSTNEITNTHSKIQRYQNELAVTHETGRFNEEFHLLVARELTKPCE
jgi:hypothetical protein